MVLDNDRRWGGIPHAWAGVGCGSEGCDAGVGRVSGVGPVSGECWARVGRVMSACREGVGRLSGICRAGVERVLGGCWARVGRVLGRRIGQVSSGCRVGGWVACIAALLPTAKNGVLPSRALQKRGDGHTRRDSPSGGGERAHACTERDHPQVSALQTDGVMGSPFGAAHHIALPSFFISVS